ncbi:hypothetical protein UPYG_G00169630 [Umbra pygmaea]|uniref:Neuromedin-K n=1 Tax=Umbra pygmaea TaxID=75934 RepID=A0ABD0WNC5_UMBPY
MEMLRISLGLAFLSFLVVFISWPRESECREDFYTSELQDRPDYLSKDFNPSMRYRDVDYDAFVGLMGRRSAGVNDAPLQKRNMDDIFVGLMGRRSAKSAITSPWRQDEYPEPRGAILVKKGRLRFVPGV